MASQVLAVRCGGRIATRSESFLNYFVYGTPDAKIEVAYYFWVIRSADGHVTVVDTGFAPEAARRRGRTCDCTPAQALPRLGVDPAAVGTVVVTHAHWDHVGNLGQFPGAEVVMAQSEYGFWTGPYASRTQFAAFAEADEIARLAAIRDEGRLTLISGRHALAPGIELIEVGGHTPGQLVVTAATAAGTVVLTSDAVHHYEEVERDMPYHVVADLAGMYRAYDLLRDLADQPRTWLAAGHDPGVRDRFSAYSAAPEGAAPEGAAPAAAALAVADLGLPHV